jgi:hypothetical protein
MSVGKYSPTVIDFYDENQNWFRDNCENENDIYDIDGYDSYGYDENGQDRDDHDENYYLTHYMDEEFLCDDPYWDNFDKPDESEW